MAWTEIVATGGVAVVSGVIVAAVGEVRDRRRRAEEFKAAAVQADNARVLDFAENAAEVATLTHTFGMQRYLESMNGALVAARRSDDQIAQRRDFDSAQQQLRLLEYAIRLLGPAEAIEIAQSVVVTAGEALSRASLDSAGGGGVDKAGFDVYVDIATRLRSGVDAILAFRTGDVRPIKRPAVAVPSVHR